MNAGRTTHGRFRPRSRRLGALALAVVVAVANTFGAAHAQDAGKIGYVDMKRLIDSAPQVLAARERLQREFAEKDRQFTVEQARLAEMDQRVRDETATLPAAELDTLRRQADALRRSIERTRQRLRDELTARTNQEIDRAWPMLNEAVAEFAREEGYDLIVPSPVVYVSGRIDITERVLERLQRDFGARGGQP